MAHRTGAVVVAALVVLAAACSGGTTSAGQPAATGVSAPSGTIELSVIESARTSTTTTVTSPPTTTSVPPTTAPPTTRGPRSWTLMAGGDVLMDRTEAAGIDPFAGISPLLASADVAFVNVEMAITSQGVPASKTFVFRAPLSAAATIARAGIDVVSVANNHAVDYGEVGLLDTLDALASAGVVAVGGGPDDGEAYRHRMFEIPAGPTVAFVAASQIMPSGFAARSDRAGIADGSSQRERVLANVRVAASEADVVIASVHWGIERDTCPSATQRSFAQALLDAGATAVIGHHPHVLQPVETTDTQLVAYSLGNFIWHPRYGITGDTGVLRLEFEDASLTGWTFHPHLLNDRGGPEPVSSGTRHQRIVDIISGDCARHDPPPVTTTPLTVPSTTTVPPTTTTTPTTTVPPTTTTTPPTTTVPPTTSSS